MTDEKQISPKCKIRLDNPPDCSDFFGMRSYALCWGIWKGVKDQKMDFGSAIRAGWESARSSCKVKS